jgi:hypothetical protein
MPYIILKRSDIPTATLQVLDLSPNTSQRNLIYDPPGQTKYVDPVQNDPVVLHQPAGGGTPVNMLLDVNGLAGWIITNLNDGTGAPGVGTFTMVVATPISAGDTVTVGAQVFVAVAGARVSGANDFSIASGTNAGIATDLAAAINDSANGAAQAGGLSNVVTAVAALAVVTITADMDGTAGNLVLATDNGAGFSPVGMVGGVDAGSLTAAESNTGAAAVLDLYSFGDLTSAPGVLTLAAINGVLVGGAAITAAQLTSVLDILAGRRYVVPGGTQIDSTGSIWDVSPAVGAEGGPAFVTNSLRNIYASGSLTLSFATGELEGFSDAGFIYAGVAGTPNGEAVVVYNDDGSFFTP